MELSCLHVTLNLNNYVNDQIFGVGLHERQIVIQFLENHNELFCFFVLVVLTTPNEPSKTQILFGSQ